MELKFWDDMNIGILFDQTMFIIHLIHPFPIH